jgi:hypothetical protein
MFNLGARAAQDDESALHTLGDFTANARLLLLSLVAIPIGIISAYVAVGLLSLINFFTNLFFFQRFSLAAASPAAHLLGGVVVIVPSSAASSSDSWPATGPSGSAAMAFPKRSSRS